MLVIATVPWKHLKGKRKCQVRWPLGFIQSQKSSDSGVNICRLWLNFSPNLSGIGLQMKKRKEISAQKCVSFHFMPYIKCYMPIQGLEVTDHLRSKLFFSFRSSLCSRKRCNFGNLPSGHWYVCWVKSWIFRMAMKITELKFRQQGYFNHCWYRKKIKVDISHGQLHFSSL